MGPVHAAHMCIQLHRVSTWEQVHAVHMQQLVSTWEPVPVPTWLTMPGHTSSYIMSALSGASKLVNSRAEHLRFCLELELRLWLDFQAGSGAAGIWTRFMCRIGPNPWVLIPVFNSTVIRNSSDFGTLKLNRSQTTMCRRNYASMLDQAKVQNVMLIGLYHSERRSRRLRHRSLHSQALMWPMSSDRQQCQH